ncbi:MAG: hypothetical protein U0587_18615 [Candidatus Binatia bacterium]
MSPLSLLDARAVLGDDVLGPEELDTVFGEGTSADSSLAIPFSRDHLAAARGHGAMLVLRATRTGSAAPLTILHMLQQFPRAFDPNSLRQSGYQLREEWGIALEPLAAADTCTPGWALVWKTIVPESCNLTYDEQDAVIDHYAGVLGGGDLRRRTAVEAIYDTLLYHAARQRHLLERSWDWSSSATLDGGYLNVGGFGAQGMEILSFSRAVRHSQLGVCPTCQPIQ